MTDLDDCCMCGDSMDHSPWLHGHQPVSMRDYYSSLSTHPTDKDPMHFTASQMTGSQDNFESDRLEDGFELDLGSDAPMVPSQPPCSDDVCESCQ